MAITNGPNLGLLVNAAEGEGHYAALTKLLRGLDLLVMAVADSVENAPPGSPADGKTVIVGTSPSGAFVGHAGNIARYSTVAVAWEFFVPHTGWVVELAALTDGRIRWDGDEWLVQDFTPDATVTFPPVVTKSGTSTSIVSGDVNTYMRFTATSAKTVTFGTGLADGEYHIRNAAAENLTLVASSTTMNVPYDGTLVLAPGMTVTVKRVASDVFDIIGQTVPA